LERALPILGSGPSPFGRKVNILGVLWRKDKVSSLRGRLLGSDMGERQESGTPGEECIAQEKQSDFGCLPEP
jgi:hypothetical protein